MRYALAAGFVCLSALPSLAQIPPGLPVQDPPAIKRLLNAYRNADEGCRGSYVAGVTDRQCDLRNHISRRLKRQGYCYGYDGLSLAEAGYWHPCNDD